MKVALLTVLLDAKKELLGEIDANAEAAAFKPVFAELEKLARRYLLLLGDADTAGIRVSLDPATGDVVAEATLTPKPKTELAKQIAAREPAKNRFAGLITPDTVAGGYYTMPLFAEEIRVGYAALTDAQAKEMVQNLPAAAKDTVEELFKGQARTMKTGEFDMAAALRGPDKNGHFSAVVAMSFDNPAALEKAFKKFMEADATLTAFGEFKWNADKAGTVDVHTFKFGQAVPAEARNIFGAEYSLAFAFAPKGIYITLGPDPVAALKDALKAKPAVAPALDVVINPAKLAKLVEKGGGDPLMIERALGREDKLLSATSLRVTSGKELSLRFALNLKLFPRAWVGSSFGANEKEPPEGKK